MSASVRDCRAVEEVVNKLKAYELQDAGADTVEANERLGFKPDLRNYGIGAQILLDLELRSIRVLTNNPRKLVGLEGYGLRVSGGVRIIAPDTDENSAYVRTKRAKLGHLVASSASFHENAVMSVSRVTAGGTVRVRSCFTYSLPLYA